MKVLAFGEVMMRLMVPDYKMLSQSDELRYSFSGTGVNILSGLYQMGYHTFLASKLPDNNLGYAASGYLRKLGIGDSYIAYGGDYMGMYFLETGFGPRATEVTYMNRATSAFSESKETDYDFESMLKDVDAVHICGIALAFNENTRQLAVTLAKKAQEKKIRVFFDFNYRPSIWIDKSYQFAKEQYEKILQYCNIVFASYKDASLILGIKIGTEESPLNNGYAVLEKMRTLYSLEMVCGTNRVIDSSTHQYLQGYLIDEGGVIESKRHELLVLDRIGGGDGFAAGIIYSVLEKLDRSKAVNFATCSGVLAHTTYGDSPVNSLKSIYRLLEEDMTDIIR